MCKRRGIAGEPWFPAIGSPQKIEFIKTLFFNQYNSILII